MGQVKVINEKQLFKTLNRIRQEKEFDIELEAVFNHVDSIKDTFTAQDLNLIGSWVVNNIDQLKRVALRNKRGY